MNKKTQQELNNLTTDTQLLRFIATQTAKSQEHLNGMRNVMLFFCVVVIFWVLASIIGWMTAAATVSRVYQP
nr:hypothetical protein [uncultured Flavobacterium sp.]